MTQYVPKPDLEGINSPPSSPLKDLAFMGAGFLLILALGFLIFGAAGEWALSKVSPEIENKVFNKFRFSLSRKLETEPKVESIFKKLQIQSGLPLNISILCDKTANALAVPGGVILLTEGLLKDVKTEMGLAFVIAHEMGHFQHRHHLKGLGRSLGYNLGLLFLGIGDGEITMANLLANLMNRAYSREQEIQADAFAMDLVTKTYGHLQGSTEFFDSALADESNFEKLASFMSTHPMTEDRINAIKSRQASFSSDAEINSSTKLIVKNPCKSDN